MRILTAILGSIAAASICSLAQARIIDTSAAYTNPSTVPVLLKVPNVGAADVSGYFPLPSSIDLSKYFKEYTTPGPILTFTVNTPTTTTFGTNAPTTFHVQLWWVDPTPTTAVENDKNTTVDADDKRIVYQNLDLTDPAGVSSMIVNAVGHSDGNKPTMNNTIFWYTYNTSDGKAPIALQATFYMLEEDNTSHLTYSYTSWNTPSFGDSTYTAGTVGLFSINSSYSLFFNLQDNTNAISPKTVATIGKVNDTDMDLLKSIGGATDKYDMASIRTVSKTFPTLPLWKTYTDDDYNAYKQPSRDDYIKITNVTISDPSGTDPTHGLSFIEDLPMVAGNDYETDISAGVDPNAAIKKVFNVSLSPNGLFSFKLRDDVALDASVVGSYAYYYRVYVNDGTNNGRSGTDYYRSYLLVHVYYPFSVYMGDAAYSSTTNKSTTSGVTDNWSWYTSSTYGWFLEQDFPNKRWVYSYEHGWIYMNGSMMSDTDGVLWFNADSALGKGTEATGDEVGWLWTNAAHFPYFYSYKDAGWVYYLRDVDNDSSDEGESTDYKERVLDKRLFWSYRQHAYITASGKDTTYGTQPFAVNGHTFGTGL